jgi:rubrerythrin
MEKHHTFTMEKIYHFMCGECHNWWSHATDMIYKKGQEMSCPVCGKRKKIMELDTGDNPRWERDVT